MKQERPGIVFLLMVLVLFSASVGILHKRKKIKSDTETVFAYTPRPFTEELLKQTARDPKRFLPKQSELSVASSKGETIGQ